MQRLNFHGAFSSLVTISFLASALGLAGCGPGFGRTFAHSPNGAATPDTASGPVTFFPADGGTGDARKIPNDMTASTSHHEVDLDSRTTSEEFANHIRIPQGPRPDEIVDNTVLGKIHAAEQARIRAYQAYAPELRAVLSLRTAFEAKQRLVFAAKDLVKPLTEARLKAEAAVQAAAQNLVTAKAANQAKPHNPNISAALKRAQDAADRAELARKAAADAEAFAQVPVDKAVQVMNDSKSALDARVASSSGLQAAYEATEIAERVARKPIDDQNKADALKAADTLEQAVHNAMAAVDASAAAQVAAKKATAARASADAASQGAAKAATDAKAGAKAKADLAAKAQVVAKAKADAVTALKRTVANAEKADPNSKIAANARTALATAVLAQTAAGRCRRAGSTSRQAGRCRCGREGRRHSDVGGSRSHGGHHASRRFGARDLRSRQRSQSRHGSYERARNADSF